MLKHFKGDSAAVFTILLGCLKCELPVFYLAHWYNYLPLLSEIDTISEYFKDN